jgi:3-dehydroquinate synthase
MVAEAVLSNATLGFPEDSVGEIRGTITRLYGESPPTIRKAEILMEWMKSDKKNRNNRINFTLLEEIGKCRIDVEASAEEIRAALIGK